MTKAEMYASVVECPSQGLNCIKGMIGDVCESGIWDTPVAGNNGMVAVPPSTLGQIFIPYNDFWVQQCAVQTDGVECLYYVELSSVAGNVLKTKWVFKYAAPNLGVPNPCGVAPTVPATPATPTDPSGGTSKPPHGNKPPHAGGPNK
jgi:hypothetical protein